MVGLTKLVLDVLDVFVAKEDEEEIVVVDVETHVTAAGILVSIGSNSKIVMGGISRTHSSLRLGVGIVEPTGILVAN